MYAGIVSRPIFRAASSRVLPSMRSMVVAFADDVNIPPALNREVADVIPGCVYVEISGAGHSGGVTHRREVRRHVLPFLLA